LLFVKRIFEQRIVLLFLKLQLIAVQFFGVGFLQQQFKFPVGIVLKLKPVKLLQ